MDAEAIAMAATTSSPHVMSGITTMAPLEIDEQPWTRFYDRLDVHVKELWHGKHGTAGLLRFQPGAHETPHEHHAGHHHLWLIDGTAVVNDVELRPGSYVHIPTGVRHTIHATDESGCIFYFVYATGRERE